MAVHVPLSVEAQMEARTLMLASNNVLFPATANRSSSVAGHGAGPVLPTRERINAQGRRAWSSPTSPEVERALDNGASDRARKISVRLTSGQRKRTPASSAQPGW